MNSLTISPKSKAARANWNDPSIPFVSVLVHELRNPLTNIMLTVHLLESRIMDDADRLYMDIIKRSSERINELINDVLKEQAKDKIKSQKHSIHQLLDEVIELARDKIILKNIVIKKSYSSHDLKIKMDRPKIKIALTNIVINSIDAMSSGNGELKFGTKSVRGKYAVSIQDNGCGISKEKLPLIFNPYFTDKPGGLGVGLAATHDIFQSNHVGVKVESVVGKGTRFILLFQKNMTPTKGTYLRRHQHTVCPNKILIPIACET